MRLALRQARWDITPVQCYLRDAFFNLGCYGANDFPEEYCAESYQNRSIPIWCWQFDQIERGMNSYYDQSRGEKYRYLFLDEWQQQRLGSWKRILFAQFDMRTSTKQ